MQIVYVGNWRAVSLSGKKGAKGDLHYEPLHSGLDSLWWLDTAFSPKLGERKMIVQCPYNYVQIHLERITDWMLTEFHKL